MIGLIAHENDLEIAAEFFELFKTPWEKAVPEKKYRVVLSADGGKAVSEAELLLAYGAREADFDRKAGVSVKRVAGPADVEWDGWTVPIYGALATFDGLEEPASGGPTFQGRSLEYRRQNGGNGAVWRIGYDLFGEIRHLLTEGQPASRALVPTLELHIALLRRMLSDAGIPFVEIPPRPEGYDFICCLTHDVDFFGLRRQGIGRTTAGFLYRATLGSLPGLVSGRRTWRQAVRSWKAALQWPFVLLGLTPDIWQPFDDYRSVESHRRPTFFLVPRKGYAGAASPQGPTEPGRAVAYDADDIRKEIEDLGDWGCEIGLHGLDAWRDADAARDEKAVIERIAGRECRGVRMHWLYFDSDSPAELDRAGLDYDATFGYNEAVGFRAGTAQPFRPRGAKRLLELPLIVQDTALFFRDRMGLTEAEAMAACDELLARVDRCGGVLTVDWHERSLAPERLWDDAYRRFLSAIERRRAHFLTAGEATDWFRARREVRFECLEEGSVRVQAPLGVFLPMLVRRYGVDGEEARIEKSESGIQNPEFKNQKRLETGPAGTGRTVAAARESGGGVLAGGLCGGESGFVDSVLAPGDLLEIALAVPKQTLQDQERQRTTPTNRPGESNPLPDFSLLNSEFPPFQL
jgi:hypothetical protein